MKGTWTDGETPLPPIVADAQIQAETQRAAARFGYRDNANAVYIVLTPPGHSTFGFRLS